MAVASTVTPSTRWPTTSLPSLACQVGPPKWSAEPPAEATRCGVAGVDLNADGMTDQEHLVAVFHLDGARHDRSRRRGSGRLRQWQRGHESDGHSQEQAPEVHASR